MLAQAHGITWRGLQALCMPPSVMPAALLLPQMLLPVATQPACTVAAAAGILRKCFCAMANTGATHALLVGRPGACEAQQQIHGPDTKQLGAQVLPAWALVSCQHECAPAGSVAGWSSTPVPDAGQASAWTCSPGCCRGSCHLTPGLGDPGPAMLQAALHGVGVLLQVLLSSSVALHSLLGQPPHPLTMRTVHMWHQSCCRYCCPQDAAGGHAPGPCWGPLQAPPRLACGSLKPLVLLQMLLPLNVPLVGMHLGYVVISWLGLLPWSRDRLAAFAHVADILFAMVVQMVLPPSVSQTSITDPWCRAPMVPYLPLALRVLLPTS